MVLGIALANASELTHSDVSSTFGNAGNDNRLIHGGHSAASIERDLFVPQNDGNIPLPPTDYTHATYNTPNNGYNMNIFREQDVAMFGAQHSQFETNTIDDGQSTQNEQNTEDTESTAESAVPVSKHVEITKSVPYPIYKHLHVPGKKNLFYSIFEQKKSLEVEIFHFFFFFRCCCFSRAVQRPIEVKIPHPVLVPVPQSYPIHIPVSRPVAVPLVNEIKIPIEKIVPFPVVKKVPYYVEKHVPYHVEKFITIHKKIPYPIKVPVVKTIIHRVNSRGEHYTRLWD